LSDKVYFSDIFLPWTMAQQEAVVSAALADWPADVAIYRDRPNRIQRRAKYPGDLAERARMLRATNGHAVGQIFVASLAVLAWDENDLRAILRMLQPQGVIVSIDDKLTISQSTPLAQAIAAWKMARKRSRTLGIKLKGAKVSAGMRKAVAAAGVARIKPFWGLSSNEWPTWMLREMAGTPAQPMAYNTIVGHLGVGRAGARKRRKAMLRATQTTSDPTMAHDRAPEAA
jgi:hypothetical protein